MVDKRYLNFILLSYLEELKDKIKTDKEENAKKM